MKSVDILVYSLVIGGILGFIYIVWSYARGLRDSPRDMWFLFGTKILEYTAYSAMNMSFILWLSRDCGLGDISAGVYISVWSMGLSIVAMVAGALVDSIGIKRVMFISVVFLLISRFFMAWLTNPTLVMILGFIPLALGFAIVGPVISVAIKRFTNKESAALGFGLFYVVMNAAYAIGGWLFDYLRVTFVERDVAGKIINENFGTYIMGMHFSTYQITFLIGFVFTLLSSVFIFMLRKDWVNLEEDGTITVTPVEVVEGTALNAFKVTAAKATRETVSMIKSVISEKFFWIFIGMLTMTLFVRFVFFHFHYTFPKYGVRVLGEGAKIGSIYGVLNPVLVIYLTPLVAALTKKVSSYKMLLIGSAISSLSVFIAAFPASIFDSLTHSVLGELIFVKWLGVASNMQDLAGNPPSDAYWPLIFFILVFTVGEAIWSPRLMQFTAEIAPKGKEGTYLALSILPFFAAKFVVGPMSGWLVRTYTPMVDKLNAAGEPMKDALGHIMKVPGNLSEHYMVWIWIGGMAVITPIGLLLFRSFFKKKLGVKV
ncbi:MFS transporter [bacterium]|nr:MFS transporter [bacterium]